MSDYLVMIDNDIRDIELTTIALQNAGCKIGVQQFTDGLDAIDYLAEKKLEASLPKFILLDLKMPKYDGIQILRKLKSIELLKSVPIIILTSSKQDKDVFLSYENLANAYIVKSIDFSVFIEDLKRTYEFWGNTNIIPR